MQQGTADNVVAMLSDFRLDMAQKFERLLSRLDQQDEVLEALNQRPINGTTRPAMSLIRDLAPSSLTGGQCSPNDNVYSANATDESTEQLHAHNRKSKRLSSAFHVFDMVPEHHRNQQDTSRNVSVFKSATDRTASSVQRLARSSEFEMFFGLMILLNSIWIGYEVEYQATNHIVESPFHLAAVTHLFSFAFVFELVLRLIAEKTRFFTNTKELSWNLYDFFLVFSSMIEFVIFLIKQTSDAPKDGGTGNLQNLRLVRMIRAIRLLRLLRIARILRLVRALRVLVHSIVTTLRSLIWALFLLTVIIFFFSILFTKATTEYLVELDVCEEASCTGDISDLWQQFGTIPRSMFTLYKAISNGIDWGVCTSSLGDINGLWVACFVCYIAFCYFAVLNIVTGVFCQKAIESAQRDRELMISTLMENKEAHVANIKSQFTKMFRQIDTDGSGTITFEEFQMHMDDEKVSGFFILLDIDSSDAFALFKLLDDDNSGFIDADEFIDGCLRLQGPARSIDLAKVRHECKTMLKKIHVSNLHLEQNRTEMMSYQTRQLDALLVKIDEIVAHRWTASALIESRQQENPFDLPSPGSDADDALDINIKYPKPLHCMGASQPRE